MEKQDVECLKRLRKEIFLAAYSAGIGHLASAYSSLEMIYTLYIKGAMKVKADSPAWEERDVFILSKGHASLALYAVMSEAGFFGKKELYTFSRPRTRLGGEPKRQELPGIEASTGSLGHGLAVGVGMAIANKMDGKENRVIVLVGDGECQEGSIWESILSAGSFHLDNLLVLLDCNHIQKMGPVSNIMGKENWRERWEAFGWECQEVDGHDVDEIERSVKEKQHAPKVIVAHTVKGHGVSIMENNPSWHWRLPTRKEMKVVVKELNIEEEELEACRKHIS